ncbi:hypothetical protein [Bradyrhizobium stylosanthis]|uniref:Uncharacterized protein n=1 Tax=Bradyrhizobium stylosanthis TaxID=1803665 RepID=A0A560CXK2_9BRAD|nr:hypothetical protein [Bradyrhizobium stylosanthis]TWA89587.1 hypothetical protein FBZ96_11955 [Bradyrhizobium stylosanthis]
MGMFDDLIPQKPAQAPAPTVSFDDLIPQQGAPAAPPVATEPVVIRNGRIVVTPAGVEQKPQPIDRPVSLLPSSVGGAVRDFQVGAQGVGKGLTDIVTGPFDLVAGAQNAIVSGINKVAGTNIPLATPASKLVEKAVDATGIPVIDPATMSRSEKLAYDANRFGTQAVGTGAMLAQRAPQVAEAVVPSETFLGRVGDAFARPYIETPTRAHVGDAIGGLGAGVGVNAADNYVPDNAAVGGTVPKQVANALAPVAGAVGATTLQGLVEGLVGAFKNAAIRATQSAPAPIPLNPATKAPYSMPEVDQAARKFQAAATDNPRLLARNIEENASELANPAEAGAIPVEKSQLPTSGLLSQDPGLVTLEQGARTKRSPDFTQRDQNVKEAAAERVASVRDPEADLGSVMRRAGEARTERLAPAEQRVNQFEDLGNRVTAARQQEGATFSPLANSEAKANASRRLDNAVVEGNYIPARQQKNELFDTAPGRNEQLPADDVFGAIDRIRRGANDLAPGTLPEDFVRRLDALRPVIDPETGANLGGPGTALGGDLADLRKFIAPAIERAQRSGNFDLADNLSALRRAVNRTIGDAEGYTEANANYQRFADRFRPEPNDPGAKFTRAIDRGGQNADGELNRGSTPPSETAGKFLGNAEEAAALRRIQEGAPSQQAGETAVRDYLRSDFASSALNADGTLNPARASAWRRNMADVLSQFPAVRSEFDNIVASAQRGENLSLEAKRGLDAARANRKQTEADVERGAIGTLLKKDPRSVAQSVLNDKYGGPKQLDDINALVKNDEQAARGWKASVAEVLTDKVQSTRQTGETFEVQYARLAKEFKDNEQLLAKVFTPEEMNTLRQGHKLLSYFKEAEKRATTGSQTAERLNIPGWVQLAVRHFKGDLAGGGLIKRFKLLMEQLPNSNSGAEDIVHMAFFDPAVAAYLLKRPLPSANSSLYNINLRRLLAAANASRESGDNGD